MRSNYRWTATSPGETIGNSRYSSEYTMLVDNIIVITLYCQRRPLHLQAEPQRRGSCPPETPKRCEGQLCGSARLLQRRGVVETPHLSIMSAPALLLRKIQRDWPYTV